MFKRIDHVEIVTDQPNRTIQFYTEVLGFKIKSRNRVERSGVGRPTNLVFLELGGTTVELRRRPEIDESIGRVPSPRSRGEGQGEGRGDWLQTW